MKEYSWNSNLENFDADSCVELWALSHRQNTNMSLYQIKNYSTLQGSTLYIGADTRGHMTTLGIQTRTETNHNHNYCGTLSIIDYMSITNNLPSIIDHFKITLLKGSLTMEGIKSIHGSEVRKEELISICNPCDKIQSTILIIDCKILGVLISKNNMWFATGSIINQILPLFKKPPHMRSK
ncbi:MAG TPA: hypothetical protein PK048_03240 [Candidatus Absconditabacterales bacterium]|nr:hypothetical protein [Candidatus Absconditabacterales bacterium]